MAEKIVYTTLSENAQLLHNILENECGTYNNCDNITCSITISKLNQRLKKTTTTTNKYLKELKDKGLLVETSKDNYTVLELWTFDTNIQIYRLRRGHK